MAQPNISGYTIVELLGAGGFASVYLATEDVSGRRTAIKVLHDHASKPDDVRRFERERMSMRALSGHPNIVGVYDSGETEDGQHYTVLEHVDGGSVRDKINEGGALDWATAVVFIKVTTLFISEASIKNEIWFHLKPSQY